MSRIVPQTQLTIAQLIAQAKRSVMPLEIRKSGVVVVVLPRRDYEHWRVVHEAAQRLVTRPRKTLTGHLAETARVLRQYEKKYKMTSAEFYRRFQAGELDESERDYFDWRMQYNAHRRLKKQAANGKR